MRNSLKTRTLRTAANLVGGASKLRNLVSARNGSLMSWLTGREEAPDAVFLEALDVILDELDEREQNVATCRRAEIERRGR